MFNVKIELEFENVGFIEGGNPEKPEKNPQSKVRTNNKLNPHETVSTGIEPGSQKWEASAYPLRQRCSHGSISICFLFAYRYESLFGSLSSSNLCVTQAMKDDLWKQWGVRLVPSGRIVIMTEVMMIKIIPSWRARGSMSQGFQ